MTNNYSLRYLTIFSYLLYIILALTNNYYSIEEAVILGFADSKQYLKIFEASPGLPSFEIYTGPGLPIENVTAQQGYRFLLPYIIGAFSHFTQIDIYYLTIFLVFITHLLTLSLFNQSVIHIGAKKNFSIIIISALIFNAYSFRPSLISPYVINDWIFLYGLLLIATYALKNKANYFYIGLVLCAITRQTALILNVLFFMAIIFNFKNKINTKIYLNGILINIIIFIFLTFISSNFVISSFTTKMYTNHLLSLFYFNYSFSELIIFFIRFINTHLFIILLSIIYILNPKSHNKLLNFEMLFLVSLGLLIWVQPILAGPTITGGNISRLTIISMPIFLIFFLIIFKDKEIKFNYTIIIIVLLFLSSLHHNYTYLLNYFFDYKNFHFGGINFFIHLIIFIILFKNNNELNKVK